MQEYSYKKIVDLTLRWLGLSVDVDVELKDKLLAGTGSFADKKIELPKWINKYDVQYRIYYVVHELCHCLLGYEHNDAFKNVEDLLLSLWDIRIVRFKVYPKQLFWNDIEIHNIPPNAHKHRKRVPIHLLDL